MANAPARPCTTPGCRHMQIPGSTKCELHDRRRKASVEAQRTSDEEVAKVRRWYKSRIWYARRLDCLKRAMFRCATPGCTNQATDVDHIQPHRGDWDLFIDRANHQALCHSCHSRKTAQEDGGFGNRRRVAGQDRGGQNPPGSFSARDRVPRLIHLPDEKP